MKIGLMVQLIITSTLELTFDITNKSPREVAEQILEWIREK